MKKFLTILLTPIFVLIQVLIIVRDTFHPIASGVADTMNELFCDMYEFWEKIFKWKDGE